MLFSSIDKATSRPSALQKLVERHELFNKAGNPAYDYWMEMAALNVPDEQTVDGNIARRVAQLMDESAKGEKPFFLAAGFRRPHLLWVAPRSYFDMYPPEKMELPNEPADHREDIPAPAFTRGAPDMTDAQRRGAIASYYAAVSHVDAQLGVLLDALDRNKLWENTIVIFTSDHGWHLGQHGLWGKVSLFQESARVPLIVAAPGVAKAGEASPRTVEMIDFFPTLTQLAGLSTPEKLDGQSLVPLLKDPQLARDRPAISVLRRGNTWGRRCTPSSGVTPSGATPAQRGSSCTTWRAIRVNTRISAAIRARRDALALRSMLATAGSLRDADAVNKSGD